MLILLTILLVALLLWSVWLARKQHRSNRAKRRMIVNRLRERIAEAEELNHPDEKDTRE